MAQAMALDVVDHPLQETRGTAATNRTPRPMRVRMLILRLRFILRFQIMVMGNIARLRSTKADHAVFALV